MRIVEVHFPPSARVAFESGARDAVVHQQVWMLEGSMVITLGAESHRLREGDLSRDAARSPDHVPQPDTKARALCGGDRVRAVGQAMIHPPWLLRRVHALDAAQIDRLAEVLIDCTEGGASVGVMQPLSRERAIAFWQRVAQGVVASERVLLLAEDADGICGTVQLVFAQYENQPHRADLCKLLVHRRARRKSLGAALTRAAEEAAFEHGKALLVLDTASGEAERLYERLGWVRVGVIPRFALLPNGGLCTTTLYYRDVSD